MANLLFADPGGDAVQATGHFNIVQPGTGTVSFDNTQKVVGVGSWKFDSGGSGDVKYVQAPITMPASGRFTAQFRYDEVPSDPKTLTRFVVSAAAYSGGGFNNPDAAQGDNGVYATATPAKNAGQGTVYGNLNLNDLPLNADIDNVKIIYERKYDTPLSEGISRVKFRINGVEGPDHDDTNEPITDTVVTVDVTNDRPFWERQDLLNGTFEVIAEARRGDSDIPHTQSWDYVKVEVGYHIPPTIIRMFGTSGNQFADIALKPKADGVVVQFIDAAYARYDGITKLLPDTWNRISVNYVIHAANNLEIKIRVNGIEEFWIDQANTGGAASLSNLQYGWLGRPGASKVCWFDQLVDDDGSDLLIDIGNKLCTAKLPATVNEDNWSSVGNGVVNERPLDDDNGKEFTGSGVRHTYALQAASVGDVDLTGKTITDYMGWARASTGDFSEVPYLVLNNLEYAVAPVDGLNFLPTGNFLKKAITSGSYPSDAAGIGMKSDDSGGHTVLHECGAVIVYEGPPDDILFPYQQVTQDTTATGTDDVSAIFPSTYVVRYWCYGSTTGRVEVKIYTKASAGAPYVLRLTQSNIQNEETGLLPIPDSIGIEVKVEVTPTLANMSIGLAGYPDF